MSNLAFGLAFVCIVLGRVVFRWFVSRNKQDVTPREKYKNRDGITLYSNISSPCARRVKMALLAKNIHFQTIEVDLLKAEQKSPEYLAINPNGKVPALRIQNVQGVPDCCLFESNVITEFLDSMFTSGNDLYPNDPWQRAQVKIWQEWELTLWEDFYPLVTGNTASFAQRLTHGTKEAYEKSFPPEISGFKRDELVRIFEEIYPEEAFMAGALECYRNLLKLEAGIADRKYLVGDTLSMADMSVFPRVAMYEMAGLPIDAINFPNITRYFAHISRNSVFVRTDGDLAFRMITWVIARFPGLIVRLSNWRSGKSQTRYDGMRALERVLGEEFYLKQKDNLWLDPTCSIDEPIVADYPTSAESLQVKILLNEMGIEYQVHKLDFLEIIKRPQGSGGYHRYQFGSKLLIGTRATLEYFDAVLGNSRFLPKEPLQRAECQCWQAWEQTLYNIDLHPIFEREWVSQMLHKRFPENKVEELLKLQYHPHYFSRFDYIMKLYLHGVIPSTSLWLRLKDDFQHLVESHDVYLTAKINAFESIHKLLLHLETSLQNRKFLVGSSLTIADICVFCRLLVLPFAGIKISTQKYPSVCEWMRRMRNRRCMKTSVGNFEAEMNDLA